MGNYTTSIVQSSTAFTLIFLIGMRVASGQDEVYEEEYPCDLDFSVEIKFYREYPNGSIWDIIGSSMYPNESYWKEMGTENDVNVARAETLRGCPCHLPRPCLRKCCPIWEDMTAGGECVRRGGAVRKFEVEVSEDDGSNPRIVDGARHFGLIYGTPLGCESKFFLRPGEVPGDEYYLRASDGDLVMHARNLTLGPFFFCVDMILEIKNHRPFICEPQEEETLARVVYPHLLMVSALFLLLTFSVYLLIPELRNLHGKILMCHVFSYFFMFLFFAMTKYLGRRLPYSICIAAAFFIQFFLLATFFWLNAMCFDICFTISAFHPTITTTNMKRERRKFLSYSFYAWGSPVIIFIITSIMQFTPELPDHIIRPEFGQFKCYFDSQESLIAYLYTPITILLSVNIIIFIVTAVKICQADKDSSILRRNCGPSVDCIKERLFLYIKLFIVMGLSWLMDFIAWIVPGPKYYFYFSEIWNSLQGVIIFIIFVCKRGILNTLLHRICSLTPRIEQDSLTKRGAPGNTIGMHSPGNTRESNRASMTTIIPPTTPMEEVLV